MRKWWQSLARRYLAERDGVAAVEFALLSPFLAAICLGLIDTSNYVVNGSAMQRAVRAGVQYTMAGGTDASTVTSLVRQSWTDIPAGANVTVSTACTCNSTAVSCSTQSCTVGGTPQKYSTITATATVVGMLASVPQTVSETIRVQ